MCSNGIGIRLLASNFLSRGPRTHSDSTCYPTFVTRVFTDSICLDTIQATEGDSGRGLGERLATTYVPCGRRSLCNMYTADLKATLLHVIGRSTHTCRLWLPQIFRWFGGMVHTNNHLAFFNSFMSKFNLYNEHPSNQRICTIMLHLHNLHQYTPFNHLHCSMYKILAM